MVWDSPVLPLMAAFVLCTSAAEARQSGNTPPETPAARAVSLAVGDCAPPLTIAKWIQGGPVAHFQPEKVYVVEFWATWCGPCVANIGHLTALQRQYADQGLIVIGVTKSDEQNTLEVCERMVAMRGSGMDYSVAFDDLGKTYAAYMDAAGRTGIPVSFVTDRAGRLAFIGHPSDLDLVVPAVLNGTWDTVQGPAQVKEAIHLRSRIEDLLTTDPKAALESWREMQRRWPTYAARNMEWKYKALVASGDAQGALACAEQILGQMESTQDFIRLHIFAWRVAVQPPGGGKPDLDLALRLAKAAEAMSGGKEGEVLRTLAKVHLLRGEAAEAKRTYDQAILVADARLRTLLTGDRESFFAGE